MILPVQVECGDGYGPYLYTCYRLHVRFTLNSRNTTNTENGLIGSTLILAGDIIDLPTGAKVGHVLYTSVHSSNACCHPALHKRARGVCIHHVTTHAACCLMPTGPMVIPPSYVTVS